MIIIITIIITVLELEKRKGERIIIIQLWAGKKRGQNYIRNRQQTKLGPLESRMMVGKLDTQKTICIKGHNSAFVDFWAKKRQFEHRQEVQRDDREVRGVEQGPLEDTQTYFFYNKYNLPDKCVQ